MKLTYPPVRTDLSFAVKLSIVTTHVRDQLDNNQLIKACERYIKNVGKLTLPQAELLLPGVIALCDKASPLYKLNDTDEYKVASDRLLGRVSDQIAANAVPTKHKATKVQKPKDDRRKVEQLAKVDEFVDNIIQTGSVVDYPFFDFSVVTKASVIQVALSYISTIKKDFETILMVEHEIESRDDKTGQGDYYMSYNKPAVESMISQLTGLIKSIQDVDVSSSEYQKAVKESKKKTGTMQKVVVKEPKAKPKHKADGAKLIIFSKASEPNLIIVLSGIDGAVIKMKSARRTELVNIKQFRIKSVSQDRNWKELAESTNTKIRQNVFTVSEDDVIHYCE